MKLSSLTLALTAYNEEANLERTTHLALEFLPQAAEQWEILIIDDGSTDGTRPLADRLAQMNPSIRVISHDKNRGMGAAIRTAIKATKKNWFCTIAADGQVNPHELKAFVEPAVHYPAVFSTYSTRRDGIDRTILTAGLRLLIFLRTGAWKIPTGNYFIRTDVIQSLTVKSDSFFANFEVFLGVRGRKLSFAWVQIPCSTRPSGASKVRNLRTIVRVARELLRYGVPS